jgi:hypothetical protein
MSEHAAAPESTGPLARLVTEATQAICEEIFFLAIDESQVGISSG